MYRYSGNEKNGPPARTGEKNTQKREKKRAFYQLNQNNQKNCKKGIDKPFDGWYNNRVREKNPNISEEKTNVYLHGKSRNR